MTMYDIFFSKNRFLLYNETIKYPILRAHCVI